MDQYLAILKFTVLLLLVVLLAYFSIKYGLRRLQPSYGQEHVKIIQRVSLDVKGERSLILIRVGTRLLLLGSAQGGISLLSELPDELLSTEEKPMQRAEGDYFSLLLERCRKKTNYAKRDAGS